ncbi:hypothetical protein HMPREF9371_2384 [Neisseria shayeganii 871]|uniref:Uncharacterized protein n=1 Tax=Neisseria shayeganii 871 TaxID=1032488 RepID=G4CL93_9NEIS|nr:hypothetical protein HMPREF9371_2384 [Neisseria shayeganii 871]
MGVLQRSQPTSRLLLYQAGCGKLKTIEQPVGNGGGDAYLI